MLTGRPPEALSEVALSEVMVGAARYVNLSAAPVSDVPPGPVTVTSTMPAVWDGATALMVPSELTVKLLAAVPPKDTAEAPHRSVPVSTTVVPPASGPAPGPTD